MTETIAGYPVHPAAAAFPLMSEHELKALAEDIEHNGQREPVTLHEGAIVDGRNRAKACEMLGLRPITRQWPGIPGQSLVSWVISENIHRRHLTVEQRAMVAQELLPMARKEAAERIGGRPKKNEIELHGGLGKPTLNCGQVSDRHETSAAATVAKEMGISEATVQRAASAVDRAPELGPLMKDAKVSVHAAEQISKLKPEERAAAVARIERGERPERKPRPKRCDAPTTQRVTELLEALQAILEHWGPRAREQLMVAVEAFAEE